MKTEFKINRLINCQNKNTFIVQLNIMHIIVFITSAYNNNNNNVS